MAETPLQWLRLLIRARLGPGSSLSTALRDAPPEGPLPSNEETYAAIDARNSEYLRLLQQESHACRVYYALESQGRFGDPVKLSEARRYSKLCEKLTRNYIQFMKAEAEKELLTAKKKHE